jgi:hypothetical protein
MMLGSMLTWINVTMTRMVLSFNVGAVLAPLLLNNVHDPIVSSTYA